MAWWQQHFGESTRGRIVALLRRGRHSVDDLAAELGVTDNAVRAQLTSLARDGVVGSVGERRDGTVGKPATLYAIAESADTAFSDAYAPTLATLLSVLGERLPTRELETIMREVGRRIGASARSSAPTLDARIDAAAQFLTDLGAVTDIERSGTTLTLRGHGCPLSEAVRARPETCRTVEQILAQATGARVREQCSRDDGRPSCSFEFVDRAAARRA